MAYELYIWGPAFGLPSIDPECIASTAYLERLLHEDEWRLIVAHDARKSPTGALPVLLDESKSTSSFSSIRRKLERNGQSLDLGLGDRQRADGYAISALLQSHALPLLDATLYTSEANYVTSTRPAYTKILPFQGNHIVPPTRLTLAQQRTLPLGLSVDDLPPSDADPLQQQQPGAEARMIGSSPSLLFNSRQQISAMLSKQQSRTKFRMDSMLSDLMRPLEETLENHGGPYLLGEDITSFDCLAFGYLSLLLFSQLPADWVADTVRAKYKSVASYTDRLRQEIFPLPIDVEKVMQSPHLLEASQPSITTLSSADLPWCRAPASSLNSSITSFMSHIYHHHIIAPQSQALLLHRRFFSNNASLTPRDTPFILTALSSIVTALVGYVVYDRLYPGFGSRDKYFGPPRPLIYAMGAAGDLLNAVSFTDY